MRLATITAEEQGGKRTALKVYMDSIGRAHIQGNMLVYCFDNISYHYADTNVLNKICVSLVHPHLEYAVPIWDSFTAKDCDLSGVGTGPPNDPTGGGAWPPQ